MSAYDSLKVLPPPAVTVPPFGTLMPSPVSEWGEFLSALEQEFVFPLAGLPESLHSCPDPSMLTCGCVVSEALFMSVASPTSNASNIKTICPSCGSPTELLAPIMALKRIYQIITEKKRQLGLAILSGRDIGIGSVKVPPKLHIENHSASGDGSDVDKTLAQDDDVLSVQLSNIDVNELTSKYSKSIAPELDVLSIPSSVSSGRKMSLAEIFQSAVTTIQHQQIQQHHQHQQQQLNPEIIDNPIYRIDSHTNSGIIDTTNMSYSSQASSSTNDMESISAKITNSTLGFNPAASIISYRSEQREKFFQKCFPMYRKQFQHSLNSRLLLPKAKKFVSTSISPDTTKIAVCTEKKWTAYWTPEDYNDSPIQLASGSSTGEWGDEKNNTFNNRGLRPLLSQAQEQSDMADWSHQIISLSNRYLAIAGSSGILRVYDLKNNGRCVYHNQSKFNIRYMTISPNGSLIACAITGIDNKTKTEQPMIVLHWLHLGDNAPLMTIYHNKNNPEAAAAAEDQPGATIQTVETVTITIPYQDVINSLSFSNDQSLLACGTRTTSHILVINVTNPHEPRMMLKTSRYKESNSEYEGITAIQFLPNSRYFAVTSVAKEPAYPMVVDSKIRQQQVTVSSRVSMLMRVEKVGSSIHNLAISPRGDAIAFLDKNGLVYLMYSPELDNSTKRIVVAADVSRAANYREAASMRFSRLGHALFILDRKGNFYIEDFAAGSPHQAGISKCRILS